MTPRTFLAAALGAVALGADSVIVNDFDSAATFYGDAGEGWYEGCGLNAWPRSGGRTVDFHMDFQGERGEVHVDVKAPLAEAACYRVDEHHPGGHDCARYLPEAAPLTLFESDGSVSMTHVDQSKGGGQWNGVGHVHLRPEQSVHLRFSNGVSEAGNTGKWWVADAWRFTKVDNGHCGGDAAAVAVAAEADPVAEMPVECASFVDDVAALVAGPCAGATECADAAFGAGAECRAGAASLREKYDFVLARCLAHGAAALASESDGVEAVLSCPDANAADESALEEITEASQAMDFDGDCSDFKMFAEQVADKCSGSRCCAHVVDDDECRYYAAGLHSLFPDGAINACAKQVKLDRQCACFVRQVSACALQAEIHDILYLEPWRPTCSNFPAMQRQQDPATDSAETAGVAVILAHEAEDEDASPSQKDGCLLKLAVLALAALAVGATCYARRLRSQNRRLWRDVASSKVVTADAVKTEEAEVVKTEEGEVATEILDKDAEAPAEGAELVAVAQEAQDALVQIPAAQIEL